MTHADREAAMCADEVVDQSKDSLVSRRLHFCVPLQLSLSLFFLARRPQLTDQRACQTRGKLSCQLSMRSTRVERRARCSPGTFWNCNTAARDQDAWRTPTQR